MNLIPREDAKDRKDTDYTDFDNAIRAGDNVPGGTEGMVILAAIKVNHFPHSKGILPQLTIQAGMKL